MKKISKIKYKRFFAAVLLASAFWGCYDKVDFSKDLNPCGLCRDCEVCVENLNSRNCAPIENVYIACGEDGNLYSFNSCDEIADPPIVQCPAGHGQCVEISPLEAECQCFNSWEGEDCSVCPGNWDEDKNCEVCKTNWDPEKDCGECLGNWDPDKDCSECRNAWTGDDCELCPEGWEEEFDCIEYCGNGIITPSEECEDLNSIQWDGCNDCNIVEFLVNDTPDYENKLDPYAAIAANRVVIVWTYLGAIYLRRFDVSGLPIGGESIIYNFSTNSVPSVEIAADGRFAVVWVRGSTSAYNVFCRLFDADANPTGEAFQINTDTDTYVQFPSIAMAPDGRFVVTWQSDDDEEKGIFAHRYDPGGNPLGDEFQVNTFTDFSQEYPVAAMAEDGRFVVAWQSGGQDGDDRGVYGQSYDADGNPTGAEFQINAYEKKFQGKPSIAMAPDGRFIVVWQSTGQDGDGTGIFGRLYDMDGNPAGEEFQVNSIIDDDQIAASATMAPDGRFVVTWQSDDDDGRRIFAHRYDSGGNPLGDEFQVNEFTDFSQGCPIAAMAEDGRFVVTWQAQCSGTDSYNVFAQRYNADGEPLGMLPW